MARKVRIATVCSLLVTALIAVVLGGVYYAARQVRPFYTEALRAEPETLERGRQELESRATTLYTDAQRHGRWQALFTSEQINGWLATQLANNSDGVLAKSVRDPRVAITHDALTLGFRTKSRGVETVISVEASVSLTEQGAVAIRLLSVRAGALPLPVMQLADEIAHACKDLKLPVCWTQQHGKPVVLVEIHSDKPQREFYIDAIELHENELYVAGHTDVALARSPAARNAARRPASRAHQVKLDEYELRLTPTGARSALQVAHRKSTEPASKSHQSAANH
jgi:hypothetical protein